MRGMLVWHIVGIDMFHLYVGRECIYGLEHSVESGCKVAYIWGREALIDIIDITQSGVIGPKVFHTNIYF